MLRLCVEEQTEHTDRTEDFFFAKYVTLNKLSMDFCFAGQRIFPDVEVVCNLQTPLWALPFLCSASSAGFAGGPENLIWLRATWPLCEFNYQGPSHSTVQTCEMRYLVFFVIAVFPKYMIQV